MTLKLLSLAYTDYSLTYVDIYFRRQMGLLQSFDRHTPHKDFDGITIQHTPHKQIFKTKIGQVAADWML